MGAIRYELRGESPDEGLIDELAAVHPRIGVEGVLRRRGIRAWPGRVHAEAAVEGFRWSLFDGWTRRWWPQGIEVLSGHGDCHGGGDRDRDRDRILVVSWFAQDVRGASQGARISIVDRRDPRHPRYHHVLLVEAVRGDDGVVTMEPVHVHAGGLALIGHRLYAAATFGGLRAFDLRDILRVTGRVSRDKPPFGYRCVLPQSGHQRLHGGRGDERMRFSFVSVERDTAGPDTAEPDTVERATAQGANVNGRHLIVGEFGPLSSGRRLGRIPLAAVTGSADPTEVIDVQEPGIPRMQGAAVINGTWFVSASNGVNAGDLWAGSGSTWECHRGVLPAGPEDLAATDDGSRLWSLCEYPRSRWVFAVDPARWRERA